MQITRQQYKLCKKQNPEALKQLYDIYKARVMGISRRYGANREEAEDILQEAFIRIFNKIDKCKEYKYLTRWIYKTTVNTAINYYYKNKKHQDLLSIEEDLNFDSEDLSAIDNLSNEQLINIINQLPDGYRLIFNLYIIEGYKHSEIAKLLGISENTSKSQLSRAKALLREKLEQIGINKFEKYG